MAEVRRFRALLAASREWWIRDEVVKVRYESLVADTAGTLGGLLAESLG